jgi:N-acetyl-gamma-glutamyl-phosphate reductase
MSFSEVMDDFRAYRVLRHQHTPEMAQSLARAAGRPVSLTFTPHLLPLRRGILATCYGRLRPGAGASEVRDTFMHKYAEEPFVQLAASADEVALKTVTGTNSCQIGFAVQGSRLVVISAIDNLVKGAAGQAVQNLNLVLGWPETAGLDTLRGFHP